MLKLRYQEPDHGAVTPLLPHWRMYSQSLDNLRACGFTILLTIVSEHGRQWKVVARRGEEETEEFEFNADAVKEITARPGSWNRGKPRAALG